ncbi:hypothetical protein [Pseudomonas arsenicoxydans]|uniref:hypothetical protein n=1 Tax=Pseudomonas arsenicoxydans TaxID=702115 RepID=UPI001127FFD4|nr:hypothetical protein [Pseudomonas arsenicoxydans]
MYEKGLTVQCPADCKVGWYYDGNGGFITAEEFAQIKKDPEVGLIEKDRKVSDFNVRPPEIKHPPFRSN